MEDHDKVGLWLAGFIAVGTVVSIVLVTYNSVDTSAPATKVTAAANVITAPLSPSRPSYAATPPPRVWTADESSTCADYFNAYESKFAGPDTTQGFVEVYNRAVERIDEAAMARGCSSLLGDNTLTTVQKLFQNCIRLSSMNLQQLASFNYSLSRSISGLGFGTGRPCR